MSSPYPIRTITADEFDDWFRTVVTSFNETPFPEAVEVRRRVTELDRSLAAFDGNRVAGTAGAVSFRMSVPGGTRPVAGVTEVAVAPTHRNQGVLRSLMGRQLGDLHDGGEAVAALFASESSIYGRFGYGCAARELSLRLRPVESRFVPHAPALGKFDVRIAEPEQVRAEMAQVCTDQDPVRPGTHERNEAWWSKHLFDPPERRGGAGPLQSVLVQDDDRVRGYALFAVRDQWDEDDLPDQVLTVRELCAVDPEAYAGLWRHLLDRALVGTVLAGSRPLDEPLLRLLADPRRARPRVKDNLWVRVVDVGRALAQRAYSRPVDLVLDVADDFCPDNAGRWRLAGDDSGATCERSSDSADVSIDVTDLGAAYLGGGSFVDAGAAGLAAEHRPGALRTLSAAMHWDPQPWCAMGF